MKIKINQSILFTFFIGSLFFITKFSLVLLNKLFYLGLVCFLIGGGLFLIKKNVFSQMFRSFKKFHQTSSKVEEYVADTTKDAPSNLSFNISYLFIHCLLGAGITLIIMTMISAITFY